MSPADGTPSLIPEAGDILTPALMPFFEREVATERAWMDEQKRSSGVCWSGMSEVSRKPRTYRDMIRDAQFAMQREQDSRQAYLTSNLGKARASIAKGCRAAERLHARLNDVGSALSRGDGSAIRKAEDAFATMRELRQIVADMEAFVRLAGASQ